MLLNPTQETKHFNNPDQCFRTNIYQSFSKKSMEKGQYTKSGEGASSIEGGFTVKRETLDVMLQ